MAEHALDPHDHYIQPMSVYVRTFVALLALMALTIVAAKLPYWLGWHDLPESRQAALAWFNNIVALTIACVKATIVILYFMGVKHSTALTKLFAIMGFVWFSTMFILFCDYATRSWEPVRGWEQNQYDAAQYGKTYRGEALPVELGDRK